MTHLLVTNDFPPKVGGIQSYLWELWRRLPPDSFAVLTTPHDDAECFDAAQPFRVERTRVPALVPNPALARRIDRIAAEIDADLVLLDPALPLGAIGRHLSRPYGVVIHGAEVTVPGRLPVARALLGHVLRGAELVVAAGGYPAREAERAARTSLPTACVPPGVDVDRFRPVSEPERRVVRERFGVADDAPLIVSTSRLVPRKGMDVLVDAAARLQSGFVGLRVLIGGTGRDEGRLRRRVARSGAPVEMLGFVPDDVLPGLLAAADVYAMLCHDRWGGLEQEGFGIVFVEAAAAGTAQVAGASGGADEAVAHDVTGVVVARPRDPDAVSDALAGLLADDERRHDMEVASRERAVSEFSYDVLAARLRSALGTGDAS